MHRPCEVCIWGYSSCQRIHNLHGNTEKWRVEKFLLRLYDYRQSVQHTTWKIPSAIYILKRLRTTIAINDVKLHQQRYGLQEKVWDDVVPAMRCFIRALTKDSRLPIDDLFADNNTRMVVSFSNACWLSFRL